MKEKIKLITNSCPLCGETMLPDKYDYYLCPVCDSQFIPGPQDVDERTRRKVILDCQRNGEVSNPTMRVKSKIGGSKSSKGHSKKQLMQKKSTKQIYDELAASPNKIILRKVDK